MEKQTPEALTLVQQFITRWKAESPNFFKQIGNVSMILAIITGIPEVLDYFEITLPAALHNPLTDAILHISVATKVLSKLTVATPETHEILKEIKETGESELNVQPKSS